MGRGMRVSCSDGVRRPVIQQRSFYASCGFPFGVYGANRQDPSSPSSTDGNDGQEQSSPSLRSFDLSHPALIFVPVQVWSRDAKCLLTHRMSHLAPGDP